MPVAISATEIELLSFFECEPELLDPRPWIYNSATYSVDVAQGKLTVVVEPSYKAVRISLESGTQVIYETNLMEVEDLRYHKDNNQESLEVVLSSTDRLILVIKPSVRISFLPRERHGW